MWNKKGYQPTKAIETNPPRFGSSVPPPAPTPKDSNLLKMWYVYDEPTKVTIYDISYNSTGYPIFLIYIDGQWIRKSAKYFRPIGE